MLCKDIRKACTLVNVTEQGRKLIDSSMLGHGDWIIYKFSITPVIFMKIGHFDTTKSSRLFTILFTLMPPTYTCENEQNISNQTYIDFQLSEYSQVKARAAVAFILAYARLQMIFQNDRLLVCALEITEIGYCTSYKQCTKTNAQLCETNEIQVSSGINPRFLQ